MSIFEKIKKFWVRKILRRVYDPDDVFSKPLEELNSAETKFFVEVLSADVAEAQEDMEILKNFVSEVLTPCDKCYNSEGLESPCFKCEGIGIVKNKQLCNWPWDD